MCRTKSHTSCRISKVEVGSDPDCQIDCKPQMNSQSVTTCFRITYVVRTSIRVVYQGLHRLWERDKVRSQYLNYKPDHICCKRDKNDENR